MCTEHNLHFNQICEKRVSSIGSNLQCTVGIRCIYILQKYFELNKNPAKVYQKNFVFTIHFGRKKVNQCIFRVSFYHTPIFPPLLVFGWCNFFFLSKPTFLASNRPAWFNGVPPFLWLHVWLILIKGWPFLTF